MDHPDPLDIAKAQPETRDASAWRSRPTASASSPRAERLIHALRTPACCFGPDGEVGSINDAWLAYAGVSIESQGPLQWIELIHAEHRYDALSRLRAAGADSDHEVLECRLADHRGNGRWFRVDLHRAGEGWLCTCADIHELKSRERELKSRASMQADMLNVSLDCIKLIAPNGNLLHMNRAGCRALRVDENSEFGMPWLLLLPEDVRRDGSVALESARKGVFSRFSGHSVIPGHEPQYWDNMLTPILDAEGKATAILCVSREVTRERMALEALRLNEERLAIAARVGGLGVWDYDIVHDALQCDENWYRIMGRDPGEPIVSIEQYRPLIHPEDVDRATEVVKTVEELMSTGLDYGIEYRILRPDGEIRWIRSVAYLQHEDGAAKRAIGFVLDITDARRNEASLRDEKRLLEDERASFRRQSLEDALTGIPNRRYLNEELERICGGSGRGAMRVCIVLVDVDHFKLYNDMYGHHEGDRALRLVASALKNSCRRSDVVARYGGEEFMIIGRHITNPVPLLDSMASAVRRLKIPHNGSPAKQLSISCGCVVFDAEQSGLSVAALIEQSDGALYEAKSQGRNRYIIRKLGA
ncbi:sensor domain-containing diguanylate cyclase [Candidimonas nitroreducens]|nr:diguanylate cyclase [Candidimonas nitroreducens]